MLIRCSLSKWRAAAGIPPDTTNTHNNVFDISAVTLLFALAVITCAAGEQGSQVPLAANGTLTTFCRALIPLSGQLGLGHLAKFRFDWLRGKQRTCNSVAAVYLQSFLNSRAKAPLRQTLAASYVHTLFTEVHSFFQLSAALAHSSCLAAAPKPLHVSACESAAAASPLRPNSCSTSSGASPLKRGPPRSFPTLFHASNHDCSSVMPVVLLQRRVTRGR